MLSILIPTYNYDCRALVKALHMQCEELKSKGEGQDSTNQFEYELILADDGSSNQEMIEKNREIESLPNCSLILRAENVGRSRIRNFLMKVAKGDLLLFMDQDGKVINDDFVEKYVEAGKSHDVVCGGMVQSTTLPAPKYRLRYLYEIGYEGKGDLPFRSFCFLIKKEVAEKVKMDERFAGYGYEDVQYGKEIRKAGYEICNINNPLENDDIEENGRFVVKTEEAMRTLHKFRDELKDDTTITRKVEQLKKAGLVPMIRFAGKMAKNKIRKNLCSESPNLHLFNIYKLFYYLDISDD